VLDNLHAPLWLIDTGIDQGIAGRPPQSIPVSINHLNRVLPAGLARMEIVLFKTVRFENHVH
jgi:hypothetical protein